ncbi:MAG: hypothetical protein WCI77_09180 [Candidatus Omnitrophota bacterium]
MNNRIIKVVLPIALDKEFDYTLPATMTVKKGSRVLVDLRGRRQVGIVVGFTDTSSLTQLKDVIEVLDIQPLLGPDHMQLAKHLAKFYPYPMVEFLFMMLPAYLKKGKKFTFSEIQPLPVKKLFSKTVFFKAAHFSARYASWRETVKNELQHGSVLILFPQVSYLKEAQLLIEKDFPGQLQVIHSRESEKQLFEAWKHSRTRSLLLGTRLALFYYPQDLRLLVIEEENSPYYFQEEKPFYHLLDAAHLLTRVKNVNLILSADYPMLATYTHIKNKFTLPKDQSLAVGIRAMDEKDRGVDTVDSSPRTHAAITLYDSDTEKIPIRIVDVAHTETTISPVVIELLRANITQNKRVAVLWNKKGFSSRIGCISCNHVFTCTNCSAALKPFFSEQKGICPYCAKLYDLPKRCPSCNIGYVRSYGVGAEKIAHILRRVFPDASVEDWERCKPDTQIIISTSKILSSLYQNEDIAVGFILDADHSLCRSGYNATFDTFLYLNKLAHFFREGLYVFTKNRQHYLFDLLTEDWPAFYEKELSIRRELCLPPYGVVATITIRAQHEEMLFKKATLLYNHIKEKGMEVYGPTKAELFKLRGNFRYSLTVKSRQSTSLRALLQEEIRYARSLHVKLAAVIQ